MRTLRSRQRVLTVAVLVLAALTAAGAAVLYPSDGVGSAPGFGGADPQVPEERLGGVITAIREVPGAAPEFLLPGAVEVSVDVRLDEGRLLTIETVDETGVFVVGQAVEVAQISAIGTPPLYQIVDLPRGTPLLLLAGLFVTAVLLLGRWQGVRALIGLGLSALVIVGLLVPALLAGRNPTLTAVVASMAVMLITLPLSHGWSMTTRAAVAGTGIALLVTIGLSLLAVDMVNLTGLSSEDVQMVRFASDRILDVRGLLLAGIIVGTLGVLDDVTVSQASTVAALRRADPGAADREVFAGALRVGRDHIAATVNTLFLAYAGAALPLLILFSVGGAPVTETLTSELVAQEVVRTLVGSIGLVLAVPLTTAIAVVVTDATTPIGHDHGHGAVDHPVRVDGATAPSAVEKSSAPPPGAGPDEPDPSDRGDHDGEAWERSLRRSYGLPGDGGGREDRPGPGIQSPS